MNIVTNAKSFKNHAKFMPDIVNILHKHAKIFQEFLQYSCKYLLRILSILALTTLHDLAKSCKKLGKIHSYLVNSCLNYLA